MRADLAAVLSGSSRWAVVHGDCLDVMREMPDGCVDAVVTDPPAGIGFMGKEWDDFRRARNTGDAGRESVFGRTSAHGPEYARRSRDTFIAFIRSIMVECLRVLKPGGHAFVWAIPRTSHWTATAVEDAGFEIRDRVSHIFGTGFPKSLDVSKAIDKAAGCVRPRVPGGCGSPGKISTSGLTPGEAISGEAISGEARAWSGFGTALKPAVEDWWLCRKSLEGTVAANVLKHGTGAINVDGCRIGTSKRTPGSLTKCENERGIYGRIHPRTGNESGYNAEIGRWPAHLVLDEEAARALDEQSGVGTSTGGKGWASQNPVRDGRTVGSHLNGARANMGGLGDRGGASRFFYVAKASRSERGEGCDHPTVKPLALMRWLCRLITPPNGVILDPFFGSGSTGCAAIAEGFRVVGIERDAHYCEIACGRIRGTAVDAGTVAPEATTPGEQAGLFAEVKP